MTRRALVVANDTYEDEALARLRSAVADAEALQEVLGSPRIGGFEVAVSRNEAGHEVQARIEDFFAEAAPDDLLLLYFSGHGLKAETGELFLAAANTRPSRLASSAVAADFVQRCMRTTRSRCVVLFLDCCYGGAFPQGAVVRAGGPVDVLSSFPEQSRGAGRGQAVITASTSMEYSFEGAALSENHSEPSVFTAAFVEGLRTGEADRDADGLISLDELYDYLYDKVRLANPAQTPSRKFDLQGELHIAASDRRPAAPPLPGDLRAALDDANLFARLGAVAELRRRLGGDDLPVALAAMTTLQELSARDIEAVARPAADALRDAVPRVEPQVLRLPEQPDGAVTRHELRLAGAPLAREARAVSDSPSLTVSHRGDVVSVSVSWPIAAGGLALLGRTGTTPVPLEVVPREVVPREVVPREVVPREPEPQEPEPREARAPDTLPVAGGPLRPALDLLRSDRLVLSPLAAAAMALISATDQFGAVSYPDVHRQLGLAGILASAFAVAELALRRHWPWALVLAVSGLIGFPISVLEAMADEQFLTVSMIWLVAEVLLLALAVALRRPLLAVFCALHVASYALEVLIARQALDGQVAVVENPWWTPDAGLNLAIAGTAVAWWVLALRGTGPAPPAVLTGR